MNVEFNGKGLTEFHLGEWRFQFHYPAIDFVLNKFEHNFAVVTDTAFRIRTIHRTNTDGTKYSYFAFAAVFVVGFAVDYLAGRARQHKDAAWEIHMDEVKRKNEAKAQLEWARKYCGEEYVSAHFDEDGFRKFSAPAR